MNEASHTLMNTMLQWDVIGIRNDFPILSDKVNAMPLVYLDNAATTQRPSCVIEAINYFYRHNNANVHRGTHYLSQQASERYELTRQRVCDFINARTTSEIIFTRGTTESINLVAQSYGRSQLQAGDEVIISAMEHHANIVPWQLLRDQIGIVLKIIPMNDQGELLQTQYEALFTERTKLVALCHVSNALGTINPVKAMIASAHKHDVPVLLDSAQATVHERIDVQDLDCDFMACSGHKMFGPTGIGVLYGKEQLLEQMPPYQGGGDMIHEVTFEHTTFNTLPFKFEAGTPNIAGTIGLGAAINYLENIDWPAMQTYESELLHYATQALQEIAGLKIYGQAQYKAPVISFTIEGVHAFDLATLIDHSGIAVRAGHHCAMPALHQLGVNATVRASFCAYNTFEEVDHLVSALLQAKALIQGA